MGTDTQPPNAAGILGGSGYTVVVRADGTGHARARGAALTARPARGDAGREGLQILVRDLDSGRFWPVGRRAPDGDRDHPIACRAAADDGCFRIEHDEDGLRAVLEVGVVPGRHAELRRLTLTDLSGRPRRLDLTTCAPVALDDGAAHAAHPVFSKLFLQTEFRREQRALLVRRRPRDPREVHPVLIHALLDADAPVSHTTDRAAFLGRGRPWDRPAALADHRPLDGRTGNVLDPVVSLRRTVDLAPGGSAVSCFVMGAAVDAAAALVLVADLRQPGAVDAAFGAAADEARCQRDRLGLSLGATRLAQDLAAAVLDGAPGLRAAPEILARAGDAGSVLAQAGIDPGEALVVIHTRGGSADAGIESLWRWWRARGLAFALVVVGEDQEPSSPAEPGRYQLWDADLAPADRDALDAAAALLLDGPLPAPESWWPPLPPAAGEPAPLAAAAEPGTESLRFDNGLGGFSVDGREYVIRLRPDADGNLVLPPQPWVNVLANDRLGCLVSETGAGCTWAGNSRENRLTPWFNDPVLDPHGDTVHLRDDATGAYFSCLPGPTPAGGSYEIRHGHGATRCRRRAPGLDIATLMFVAREDPVRVTRVRVTNTGDRPRRLSLYACSRLVLGVAPAGTAARVFTAQDAETGALLAHKSGAGAFSGHRAFGAVVTDSHAAAVHATTDRRAFLGEGLDPARPAALARTRLDGRCDGPDAPVVGAGLDPCFAHQVRLDVPPGATAEVVFLLGQESDEARACALVAALSRPGACAVARQEASEFWREGLDALQVRTPSPALDLMVNGWLGYQTLACRLRGRTAFYQSGGAFGFRDQLQDALALLPCWPQVARRQILLHAAHQFVEGDVLHWWHPPDSRGIRTRFADDLVWLPLLTADYVAATGDETILDEVLPFLAAPPLAPGTDETFLAPSVSPERADLYGHCCRALDRALTRGDHGLPLFGTGDWNDGMNRVGREGRGESVWMGFFLVATIDRFLPTCARRGDHERAARYRRYRDGVAEALDDAGWDGAWYRRGYFDDGSPLGTRRDAECRIDALVQAWSVLSGVAAPERASQVMDAVEQHLISDDDRLIRLLTPPFVDMPRDPGYIKGYVAGVRENGGQYTHAALWVVQAMARLGRRERAAALLDLLNPVHHAATPEQVARYKVEPYVVAADVYGAAPHVGRGGWTWYTGSSGWMLRVALESVLGLRTEGGDVLVIDPCVPDAWPEYEVAWRRPGGAGCWDIRVTNPGGCTAAVVAVTVDGSALPVTGGVARVPLAPDGGRHNVIVELGSVGGERQ